MYKVCPLSTKYTEPTPSRHPSEESKHSRKDKVSLRKGFETEHENLRKKSKVTPSSDANDSSLKPIQIIKIEPNNTVSNVLSSSGESLSSEIDSDDATVIPKSL